MISLSRQSLLDEVRSQGSTGLYLPSKERLDRPVRARSLRFGTASQAVVHPKLIASKDRKIRGTNPRRQRGRRFWETACGSGGSGGVLETGPESRG